MAGAADEQEQDHERADRRVTEDPIVAQERRCEAQGLANAGADGWRSPPRARQGRR